MRYREIWDVVKRIFNVIKDLEKNTCIDFYIYANLYIISLVKNDNKMENVELWLKIKTKVADGIREPFLQQ